jgi:phosphohistidine phosphatase SixA
MLEGYADLLILGKLQQIINTHAMRSLLPLLTIVLTIAGCAGPKYIYVVRHAEKLDNTPYSVLSAAGHQRAAILRDSLINKKIDIVFATPFKRTQETAQPTADAFQKVLLLYRNNAVDSMVQALKAIKSKNILLVGHSGNLPSIIEGLTGQKVNPIQEHEYDNLYIIRRKKDKIELRLGKYGNPSTH